jgi:hypothetical protein
MGHASTDHPVVCFDRAKIQPTPREDALVGLIHLLVAHPSAGVIPIKAVRIFHNEFASTHEAKPGPDFITKFGLDLVAVEGQLTIGADFAPEQIRDHFFVGWPKTKVAVMPVLAS